jgi:uncharacterized membrane protein YqjE
MSPRIIYQVPTLAAPPPPPINNHQNAHGELRSRLSAALAAGFCTTILVTLVALLIASLGADQIRWEVLPTAAAVGAGIGLAVFASLGALWSVTVATRDWKIDDIERAARFEHQRFERERQKRLDDAMIAQGELPAPEPGEDTDAQTLNRAAYQILGRYFEGHKITRDACVEAGLCDQATWNEINRAFVALGWKRGYTLRLPADNLPSVWGEWVAQTEFANGNHWIRQQRASGHTGGSFSIPSRGALPRRPLPRRICPPDLDFGRNENENELENG